jgi:dual specificity MAP kinase phosphatase
MYRHTRENYSDESVLGFSKIVNGLYLGNKRDAENFEALQSVGVRSIVNATNDIPNFFSENFEYHRVPVVDHHSSDIGKYIPAAVDFIDKKLKSGSVLVHCFAGVSRSSTIVIAYLILKRGMSYQDALNFVVKKRSIVRPNPGFAKTLANLSPKRCVL